MTGKICSKLDLKHFMRTVATVATVKGLSLLEMLEQIATLNVHGLVMSFEGVVTVQEN